MRSDLPITAAPRPRAGLATVELDGETVIYDERTAGIHLLDKVATVIWRFLDGENTLERLARELSAAYGTDEPTVARDVLALARQLDEQDLFEPVDAEAPAS